MNSEGRDNGAGLVIMFLVAVGILLLVLLFKIFIVAGLVAVLIGIVVFIFGLSQEEGGLAVFGAIVFFIGIGIFAIGLIGTNFFEGGVGKPLVDGSHAIVDSGVQVVKATNEAEAAASNAQKQAYDSLGQAINSSLPK